MTRYCKAYKLEDLRKYPQWAEATKESEKELNDDSIVYIQESYIVTKNPLDLDSEEDYILDNITPEWEKFCTGDLSFAVPDWEEEAKLAREAAAKAEEEEKNKEASTESGEESSESGGETPAAAQEGTD